MSDGPENMPKRTKGRVEVHRRTGGGEAQKWDSSPPEVERIKGPRPDLSQVDHGERGERRRRRVGHHQEGQHEQEMSKLFIIVSVVGCAVVVAGVVFALVIKPSLRRAGVTGGDAGDGLAEARERRAAEAEVVPWVADASAQEFDAAVKAVVRDFMEASSHEERCRFVRGGLEALPRMEKFYGREAESVPKGFKEIDTVAPLPFGGVPMQVVAARDNEREEVFTFNVFPGKNGMVIDWESSVGYGEMAWEEFIEEAPTEPVEMRVYMEIGDYYNYELADDSKYQCFLLGVQGSEESLYGYVELRGDTAVKMKGVLPDAGLLPVRVKLKWLPWSKGKRMVWIEDYIHSYWVDRATIEDSLYQ